jgi:DNA polymerase V
MDEYKLHKQMICIDLKSFYASVECSLMGLDPFQTALVVADESRGGGSIVLAVTPYLKKLGVPSRCRIHDLPTNVDIIFAKPRLHKYLEYSTKIVEIYLRYISEEDIYVYSVDEVFMDFTNYLDYYKTDIVTLAKRIKQAIYDETKVHSSCGIGPNMLMAKLALDLESKKMPDFVSKWDYEDIPTKLWPIQPLSEMWGIGANMEARLNRMGLFKIGDIAHCDIGKLKRRFGVLGEELYYHTHGIDMSILQDKDKMRTVAKSYGIGQVLFRDYYEPDVYQIMIEMVDDVTRRLRAAKKTARTIHLGIGYSQETGGGFSRQITLPQPVKTESAVYEACLHLFHEHYEGEPIRRVNIALTGLAPQAEYQFSMFENVEQVVKEQQLFAAIDEVKDRFGKNAVNRASSETQASTIKDRNKMIGGHYA